MFYSVCVFKKRIQRKMDFLQRFLDHNLVGLVVCEGWIGESASRLKLGNVFPPSFSPS
jgi:hypothetical protein